MARSTRDDARGSLFGLRRRVGSVDGIGRRVQHIRRASADGHTASDQGHGGRSHAGCDDADWATSVSVSPQPIGVASVTTATSHVIPQTLAVPVASLVGGEIARDMASAWSAVQTEWRKLLPDGWVLPTAWNGDGLYDATNRKAFPGSWMDGPDCGGTRVSSGNASYCWANDTVPSDLDFVRQYRKASGPLVVIETMAHELGHAAQARLHRAGQDRLIWPQMELQADCLAGALPYEASGDGEIDVPPGGVGELYALMAIVSDNEPAFRRGQHGNQRQREMSSPSAKGGSAHASPRPGLRPRSPSRSRRPPTRQAKTIRTRPCSCRPATSGVPSPRITSSARSENSPSTEKAPTATCRS